MIKNQANMATNYIFQSQSIYLIKCRTSAIASVKKLIIFKLYVTKYINLLIITMAILFLIFLYIKIIRYKGSFSLDFRKLLGNILYKSKYELYRVPPRMNLLSKTPIRVHLPQISL